MWIYVAAKAYLVRELGYLLLNGGRKRYKTETTKSKARKRRRRDERSASKTSRDPVVCRRPLCARAPRDVFLVFNVILELSIVLRVSPRKRRVYGLYL